MKYQNLLFLGREEPRRPARNVNITFRLPRKVSEKLHDMARAEDMSFSRLVRRAIRRRLESPV